ncbi:hypothetical protein TW81_17035 [Vibrio galatheae]|uniref:Uncharacterized protein n=1 Tax=Vibrio galatheae TaxID=579748 RepID=A0A0F4NFH2_9VIBR|nr:hypothetical protein TW81_17035 [Vibrio galatheae]
MLVKILKLLKCSIALFFILFVLNLLLSFTSIYNEMLFMFLAILFFLSAITIWFLPALIVCLNPNISRKGRIIYLSLVFPVFGGVIAYSILAKQIKV